MADELFQVFHVAEAQQNLPALHTLVAENNARVQIIRPGAGDACILISKTELDSLERALEILADTDNVRALSNSISHLTSADLPLNPVSAAHPPAAQPPPPTHSTPTRSTFTHATPYPFPTHSPRIK